MRYGRSFLFSVFNSKHLKYLKYIPCKFPMLSNIKKFHYFKNKSRGMILGLFFVVGLVYIPYINNALFFDDLPFFSNSVNYFTNAPFQFELRWLPYASIGWTWKLFGDTPLPLHLGNMLLHFANVVLVFFLLHQLTNLVINKNKQTTPYIFQAK